MQPAETQTEPEASHTLHHPAAAITREEVSREAIPKHSGAGRVQFVTSVDRDAGQNLVPKPARQGEATAGSRAGEDQDGGPGPGTRCPALHGLLPSQPDGWCDAPWVGLQQRDQPEIAESTTPTSITTNQHKPTTYQPINHCEY